MWDWIGNPSGIMMANVPVPKKPDEKNDIHFPRVESAEHRIKNRKKLVKFKPSAKIF